jgi:hypothetical protein
MKQKEFESAGIAPFGGKALYQRPTVRVDEMESGACILAGSELSSPKLDGISEDTNKDNKEGLFDE